MGALREQRREERAERRRRQEEEAAEARKAFQVKQALKNQDIVA
jgi:hypothetical protein